MAEVCTFETHQAQKARPDELKNLRRWDEAEAWCGECPRCMSTLLIPYEAREPATAVA